MAIRFNVGCCCDGCPYFLTDVTGSMGGTITTLKPGFKGLVDEFSFSWGVASYVDVNATDPQIRIECSGDDTAVKAAIDTYSASGGGDTDENATVGLYRLATQKNPPLIVWTGDAKSHTNLITVAEAIDALTNAGTIVIGLNTASANSGIDGDSQASLICAATGGVLFNNILSTPFSDVRDAVADAMGV